MADAQPFVGRIGSHYRILEKTQRRQMRRCSLLPLENISHDLAKRRLEDHFAGVLRLLFVPEPWCRHDEFNRNLSLAHKTGAEASDSAKKLFLRV